MDLDAFVTISEATAAGWMSSTCSLMVRPLRWKWKRLFLLCKCLRCLGFHAQFLESARKEVTRHCCAVTMTCSVTWKTPP